MSEIEFFKIIYKHAPKDGLVHWGSVDAPIYPTVGEVLEGATTVVGREDIFYSPAPRSSASDYKSDVIGSGVAWVDLDTIDGSREPLVPPSIVVNSGGGRHYYWLLDKLVGVKLLERANKSLISHMQADKGTHNCNRVLRVPGSINSKYEDKPACEILEAHPNRVYSANDLAKLRPYNPGVLEIPDGLSRSERDYRLIKKLADWGLTKDLLEDLFYHWSEKAQEEGDHYVKFTLGKVVKEVKPKAGEDSQQDVGNVSFLSHAYLVGERGEDVGLVIRLEWENNSLTVPASQDDFKSRRDVLALLKKHAGGTRVYRGSDLGALKLWEGLVEGTPPDDFMLSVAQSGRYDLPSGERVYIYAPGKGISTDGATKDVFWSPMIKTSSKVALSTSDLKNAAGITRLIMSTQPLSVVLPALGWVAATVFKTVLEQKEGNFPLMLLYGMQGSGKTSFIKSALLPVVGVWAQPVSADVTPFALTAHLTTTNSIPVWLNEYRSSNKNTPELERYLRTAYDGSTIDKGRPDLSVSSYPLKAPVILDGESIFSDPATRDRTISLRLGRQYIEPGTEAYDSFYKLRSVPDDDRQSLAYHYLSWAINQDPSFISKVFLDGKKLFEEERLGARAANNAAAVWMGLMMYQQFMKDHNISVKIDSPKEHLMKAMTNTYLPGLGVRTPAEYFIEILTHQFANRAAWAQQACKWEPDKGLLWFGITTSVHYIRHFWNECPPKELLIPQLTDRVGLHLVGPEWDDKRGRMYGIDIKKARELGLDIPTPKTRGNVTKEKTNEA